MEEAGAYRAWGLTFLRFSGVGAMGVEVGLGARSERLLLREPLVVLGLEGCAGGGGAAGLGEGLSCCGFFFFLVGVGASYVKKDSKDMVGVSKSSLSSS